MFNDFIVVETFQCRYTLIESIDGRYGNKNKETGEWNGMVGMVMRRVGSMNCLNIAPFIVLFIDS